MDVPTGVGLRGFSTMLAMRAGFIGFGGIELVLW